MKLYECQHCAQVLYFENTHCESCGHVLGFLPETTQLTALSEEPGDRWRSLAGPQGERGVYRFCANADLEACNWLIPDEDEHRFCRACRLNRTIPALEEGNHLRLWQRLEIAKHRMVYGLLRFDLPVVSKMEDAEKGVAFDFLSGSGTTFQEGPGVITGHENGLITIDLAEADDAERERQRRDMAEPYRTLLGHCRHEVGHYYWERLIEDRPVLAAYRETFGDERVDYGEALKAHYAEGPRPDWRSRFVSGYAASHSWEDFAETWAHYMHIIDTLESAAAFGMEIRPTAGRNSDFAVGNNFDPYLEPDFDFLIRAWGPLTVAVNSLNRSMGQPDLYPFVLAPSVIEKLRFVHDLIHAAR